MHLPLDYPRINQFPESFTRRADGRFIIREEHAGTERTLSGEQLQAGVPVELEPGVELRWRLTATGP